MPLRLIFIAILLSACELWGAAVNGYVLNPLTETRLPDIEVAFYIRQEGDVSEVLRNCSTSYYTTVYSVSGYHAQP